MNRNASIVLIVVGAVLMVFGLTAVDSFSSDISRFFTGAPTNKAIWMLIGGIIAVVVGLSGMTLGTRVAKT
jgi:hypothetical protein